MSHLKLSDIKNLSSPDLINLLAHYGYGSPYNHDAVTAADTRKAYLSETGVLTQFSQPYVKIAVTVDGQDGVTWDYGARLFCCEE